MNIKQVGVATVKKWLDSDEIILIDVRETFEHKVSKIVGAYLIPLDEVCYDKIPHTDKKIVLYCKAGMRSAKACNKLLEENNSISVYNMEGGIVAWIKAGFPIDG